MGVGRLRGIGVPREGQIVGCYRGDVGYTAIRQAGGAEGTLTAAMKGGVLLLHLCASKDPHRVREVCVGVVGY